MSVDLSWMNVFPHVVKLSLAFVRPTGWRNVQWPALYKPSSPLSSLNLRGVADINILELASAHQTLGQVSLEDCTFDPASVPPVAQQQSADESGLLSKLEQLTIANQKDPVSSSSFVEPVKYVLKSSKKLKSLSLSVPVTDPQIRELLDRDVCRRLKKSGVEHLSVESRNVTAGCVELLLLSLASEHEAHVSFTGNFSGKDIARLENVVKDTVFHGSSFSRCV